MSKFSILFIDDDKWYSKTVQSYLEKIDGVELLVKNEIVLNEVSCFESYDLVILDYLFPSIDSGMILKELKKTGVQTKIIFLSSQTDMKVAVNLMRENIVVDYIIKDQMALPRLMFSIQNLASRQDLQKKVDTLEKEKKKRDSKYLIGVSREIEKMRGMIQKIAPLNTNILIQGETGSGKDVLAKEIHYRSCRSKDPFIAINCGAIPENLLESELFGYEKGAFTGADKSRAGKFEQAGNGTLFLDEIGDMPYALQVKILRILEERKVTRLGGTKNIELNCRVISATNIDLQKAISEEKFRSDLYYRLKGFVFQVSSLRDRKDDIPVLSKYFLEKFANENKMKEKKLTTSVLRKLKSYDFPGNVRELKSIIDLACVLSDGEELELESIQFENVSAKSAIGEMTLKAQTDRIIEESLQKYNYDVRLVANKLGVGKSTIYRYLKTKEV